MADFVKTRDGGFQRIVVATLIAGVGGYAITTVAARFLGAEYRTFAAFWAVLYLAVGALSGIQQEVTRSTSPRDGLSSKGGAKVVPIAIATGIIVAVLTLVSALVWAPPIFGKSAADLALPVATGAAFYVGLAAVTGTMYGIKLWKPLSVVIALDVCVRLVLVVVALAMKWNMVALCWMVVAPFPIVLAVVWFSARKKLLRSSVLDSGYRRIALNISRTVVAAASTAALVSGFPAFLGAAPGEATAETLSALIFALTITRAPLVVSTLALQSYLVVFFRDRPHTWSVSLLRVAVAICGGGTVFAFFAWLWGPGVIGLLVGKTFVLSPWTLGLLTLSSIPTALIALSGSAVLARASHNYYSAGWIVSAVVAVAIVFSPIELLSRTLLALSVGPLVGLAIHLLGLVRSVRSRTP